MSSTRDEFILLLKSERKKQRLSYRKLADMCGLTYQQIWNWERKVHPPSLEGADKVLKVLGISLTIGKEIE